MNFEQSIFDLAYKGFFEEIKEKIQESRDIVFSKDTNERLLIHWAALGGFTNIVKYLIELESPIDSPDDIGMTPLILASSANKLAVVQLLLEKGANVNSQNNEGHSSIQYAASKGWKQVLELLIRNGADVNIMDRRRATPLHRAASKGDIDVINILISLVKNLDINVVDVYGNTPLHLACEEDNVDVAELLIHQGARVDLRNKDEKTPIEMASQGVQKLLLKLVDAQD